MEYSVGRGLRISKYTMGTVQLGLSYGIANHDGKPDAQRSRRMLDTAARLGINTLDTAVDYGNSEEVIGGYFKESPARAEHFITVTKFKIRPEDGVSPAEIEKQVFGFLHGSLGRLGLQRIPILLLHTADDMFQYGDSVPNALRKAKEEGLIERAGVSVYSGEEISLMLRDGLYEAVQVPMNIFDQRLIRDGSVARMAEKGILVFVRSVFLQGLFFMEPDRLPCNLRAAADPLRGLRSLAGEMGLSVSQLAIAYMRDVPGVTSLVIGAETQEQIEQNAALLETPALSPDRIRKIGDLFQGIPNHILNPYSWDKPWLWEELDAKAD